MRTEELLALREEKDDFFRTSAHAPLTSEQQAAFDGLRYYPPNPDLDLMVTVEPFETSSIITVETTSGDVREYERYGRFSFEVDGQTVALTIYAAPHGYFLPFVDANAGGETYGAGRYLEPEPAGTNRFHIDFNLAYSPYCAYNPGWSCPITPAENRIPVAIRAGEMMPEGPWIGLA